MKKENTKSKNTLLIMRIVSICLLVFTLLFLIIGISGMMRNNYNPLNIILLVLGGIMGFAFFILFFMSFIAPLFAKVSVATSNEVLDSEKEGITELVNKQSDLVSPALTKYAKNIKKGLNEEQSEKKLMSCKYCGQKNELDSLYCKTCGKKL